MRLAIDIGTKMGFAWSHDDKIWPAFCDVLDFSSHRHEGGGMRFLRFRQELDRINNETVGMGKIKELYYEEVRSHLGTDAAQVHGGFLSTLQAFCEEKNIPYRGIPVGTIKKHATGKGNASKEMMIKAARENLGYKGNDNNEADALWLLSAVINNAI